MEHGSINQAWLFFTEHDKCGGYLNRQVLSFALGLIATKCSSPFSGYAGLTRNVVSCHFKFIRTTYHM